MLTLANQEALKVLSDQPACWRSSEASSKALGAISGLELDTKGPQDIDTPASSRLAVIFILAHGRGNLAVNEPVPASNVVVVAAAAGTLCNKCPDMLDGGKGAGRARFCGGNHSAIRRSRSHGESRDARSGWGEVEKGTVAGKKCYLNGGMTASQVLRLMEEGPSVHLAAICNDWRRGRWWLGQQVERTRARRRGCEAFGSPTGMWTRPKHVLVQMGIAPKCQRPTGPLEATNPDVRRQSWPANPISGVRAYGLAAGVRAEHSSD